MRPLEITAATAVSALGRGCDAHRAALLACRSGLRQNSLPGFEVACHLGPVDGLEEEPLTGALGRYDCRNNRLAAAALRRDGLGPAVALAAERYGPARVGVVLGTSTSGILATEEAYRRRATPQSPLPAEFDFRHSHDLFSLARFVRAAMALRGPAATVSTACSSSAKAVGEGAALIEAGLCDAVLVGGVDSLCGTTVYGFASLQLLAEGPCRPLAADRDGISLGEAAAFLLLERPGSTPGPRGRLLGIGASADAHHMSAPHPEGRGAAQAMRAALESAGLAASAVDHVNLHGTGTRSNDAVEDRALAALLEGQGIDPAAGPWCSSTKGWTGHTLGTSGALEAVLALICIELDLVPGCLGIDAADPELRCRVAVGNRRQPVRHVLSNSFGFGGSNCSLVLGGAAA